eukprot:420483_1
MSLKWLLGSVNPCQTEFKRFLKEKVQLSEYYTDLYDRFASKQYNDIRLIRDIDEKHLKYDIGLNQLHCNVFLKKKEIFLQETKFFQQDWLKQIVEKQKQKGKVNNMTCDGMIDLFENHAILTFDALYEYINNREDLQKIFGEKNNHYIVDVLWDEIKAIKKQQTYRLSRVSQSYIRVSISMLSGYDNCKQSQHK